MTLLERELPLERQVQRPREKPAILPLILINLNSEATKMAIKELRESTSEQRLERTIKTYKRIVGYFQKPTDCWTLNLLQSLGNGMATCYHFLENEGVFEGDDDYLQRPQSVRPGMEIANIRLADYPPELREDLIQMKRDFFAEYKGIKNVLAPPHPALPGKEPHLGIDQSFLVTSFKSQIIDEVKKNRNQLPLVCFLGPGAGEEIVSVLRYGRKFGIQIITYDHATFAETKSLLETTFQETGRECPQIINLQSDDGQIDASKIDSLADPSKPHIFVCPEIDLSSDNAIPEGLQGRATVTASLYALHEMTSPEVFARNAATTTKGSIIIDDGLPSKRALRKVVLPVIDKTRLLVTGSQAIITYILCRPPEKVKEILQDAVPNRDWDANVIPVPFPKPLLYPLQIVAVGRISK